MKEEWLMPGAVVPVDAETTAALVGEIKRMMHVVGGMALNQRYPWVGLTDDEVSKILDDVIGFNSCWGPEEAFARAVEQALKEKNHG
jgi:hypothetical protein